MILGIDHVQLAAPPGCEEKARWFFGEVLGLLEIAKPAELSKRGGCWFQCGCQQLHIGVEEVFVPAAKAHPAFVVQDLAEVKAQFAQHRVSFTDDDANPQVRRMFAQDPWGNRLEFVESYHAAIPKRS